MDDNWIHVGEVYVDSGQLCISDPCYDWDYDKDILPIALKAIDDGESVYTFNDGTCIIASTLWGDGVYPVFVKFDASGRASAMMVDFDPQDEEEEDWEGYSDEEEEDSEGFEDV